MTHHRGMHNLLEEAGLPAAETAFYEVILAMADLIAPYAVADVGKEAFDTAVRQLIDHAYQRADEVAAFLDLGSQ